MSTFCVFGISLQRCIEVMLKKQKIPRCYDQIPEVESIALELFNSDKRPQRISPYYESPGLCEEWIRVGLEMGVIRNPLIMEKKPAYDKKGNPIIKNGTHVLRDLPWQAK